MTCEATVAIVVDAVERKFELDRELMTIPMFLSRVSPGNRGFGFQDLKRIGWTRTRG